MNPISITQALTNAGVSFTPGKWIRLKGVGLDAISINRDTGRWRDHRSGDHGRFSSLRKFIPGLDDSSVKLAPAGSQPHHNNNEEEDKKSKARGKWKSGIPAVKPRKPTGWSQAAWDANQQQYQDCRDAIYEYLLNRGLNPDPLLKMIRFSTDFNPEKSDVDKEMLEAGADFYFIVPMFELGKPQNNQDNICGVQRTFLKFREDKYHPVQKIGRAMLGKKGVTEIRPVTDSTPISLPTTHPVLGAGEGLETVASFVQTMNRPGVVCWDWSGLRAWSKQITMQERSPVLALLVDNDTSETGQRESAAVCRRILQQDHGHYDEQGMTLPKAVYLLPPDLVQPDDKGNRDWNDLLKQQDASTFAAEIVKAWHNSSENMALAPVSKDEKPVDFSKYQGPKDAEIKQAIADAVDVHIASEIVENNVKKYEKKYKEHLQSLEEWKATKLNVNFDEQMADWKKLSKAERRGKEKPKKTKRKPKLPPMLIRVTTGVGKSHQIRALIQQTNLPLLILTRTHKLGIEYASCSTRSTRPVFHYHGRSNPEVAPKNGIFTRDFVDENIHALADHTCFKYPVIELVSENNHIPSLTACRDCEFGHKFMLDLCEKGTEAYEEGKEWFTKNGLDHENVPACLWLGHQAKAMHSPIVVGPNASFSDFLATFWGPDGGSTPRLVIVDELPDLHKDIQVNSQNLGLNISNCKASIEYLQKQKNGAGYQDVEDENAGNIEKLIKDLQDAISVFGDIGDWIGQSTKLENIHKIPSELTKKMHDLHVEWLPGATARWEKAEIKYGKEPFVPLRMTKAIVESVATHTEILQKGVLHVREVTALGEYIKRGKACLLLDATPSPAVEFLVKNKEGQVVEAIAKQHIKLVHYNQYLHGRTWKNREHQKQELTRLLTLRELMKAETHSTPATLTYMPHVEMMEKEDDKDWGYFGRDDIGQDNWKGRHLLIFGGPLFSPLTQALAYNSELMLMRLAGAKSLPDWNEEVERKQEVVVGSKLIESKAPLPVDPHLRDWVLHDYARRMVQGIGRVRGVWASAANPLHVWIVGGLPLAGLAAHGIEVNEYRQESETNLRDESRIKAEKKVQVAMAALQAADKDPTYRAINKWLEEHKMPSIRYDAWKRINNNLNNLSTGLNKDTYQPVDNLLASLHSLQKAADYQGCDISDIALGCWDAPSLDPEIRIAAEIVLEVSPFTANWREKRRDDG